MSLPQVPSSDRTLDPLRTITSKTVRAYEGYLASEYNSNIEQNPTAHEEHFRYMQDFLSDWWDGAINDQSLPPPEKSNIAFVGLSDAKVELDRSILRRLGKVRSILLIDFSIKVLRKAAQSLIDQAVPVNKIYYMQFDITDGLSTVLDEWIEESLASCPGGPDSFHRMVEGLEKKALNGSMIPELMDRLEKKKKASGVGVFSAGDDFLLGGENTDRKLQLSVDGKVKALDAAFYQMVTGATGVPTKESVLNRFEEEMSLTNDRSAAAMQDMKHTVARLYKLFAVFNTHVTGKNVTQMIDDNAAKTKVLLLTDYSTRWMRPKWGEMPQLFVDETGDDISGLKSVLHDSGKELVETSRVWHWHDMNKQRDRDEDEDDMQGSILEEHEHLCQAMEIHQNGGKSVLKEFLEASTQPPAESMHSTPIIPLHDSSESGRVVDRTHLPISQNNPLYLK